MAGQLISQAPPLPVGYLVVEEAGEHLLRLRAQRAAWQRETVRGVKLAAKISGTLVWPRPPLSRVQVGFSQQQLLRCVGQEASVGV